MFFFIGNPRTLEHVKQNEQSRCIVFLSTFSGTRFFTPRTFQVQAGVTF
jgi:hypothetical protein